MNENQMKPVIWIGSSYEDWQTFPANVQDVMGYALHLAQCGKKAINAKPLTGFKGASVLEIIDNYDSDTYRAVYTVQFQDAVYVLHAFQKKRAPFPLLLFVLMRDPFYCLCGSGMFKLQILC